MSTTPNPVIDTNGVADWKTSLPPELQGEKSLADIKDVPSLAKSWIETKKMVGNALKLPKADAPDTEWEPIYAKLGCPETPDKYEFKRPDKLPEGVSYDEELETEFRGMAHSLGLNGRQAQGLLQKFTDFQTKRFTEATAAQAESINVLKKEWGNDYDKNVGLAIRAVKEIGGAPLQAELDATGLGNSPLLIKHFASLGNRAAESTLILGDSTVDDTSTQAQAKLDVIMNDKNHAYWNQQATRESRQAAIKEVGRLHQIIAVAHKG